MDEIEYRREHKERHVIKAEPGYFVATYIEAGMDEGKPYPHQFHFRPIIAWVIVYSDGPMSARYNRDAYERRERWTSYFVKPLTIDGDPEKVANEWAIKLPNGSFELVGYGEFEKEAEMLAFFKDETDRERREKEEREKAKEAAKS